MTSEKFAIKLDTREYKNDSNNRGQIILFYLQEVSTYSVSDWCQCTLYIKLIRRYSVVLFLNMNFRFLNFWIFETKNNKIVEPVSGFVLWNIYYFFLKNSLVRVYFLWMLDVLECFPDPQISYLFLQYRLKRAILKLFFGKHLYFKTDNVILHQMLKRNTSWWVECVILLLRTEHSLDQIPFFNVTIFILIWKRHHASSHFIRKMKQLKQRWH